MNILENPFYILGVTPSDNREKIIELAQEKSLTLDPAIVAEAKNTLTNPRKRISAEVAWFPGLSKSVTDNIIKVLENKTKYTNIKALSPLIRYNIMSYMLSWSKISAEGIYTFAELSEKIDIDSLFTTINEDRSIANITPISDKQTLINTLHDHKNICVKQIYNILLKYPLKMLITTMSAVVNKTSNHGKSLEMINTIIDKFYIIQVQQIISEQEDMICKKIILIDIDSIPFKSPSLSKDIDILISKLEDFYTVIHPLQLNFHQRGIEYPPSVKRTLF